MKTRFFRYSGSKLNYIDLFNPIISTSKKNIYIEPFVGSGAVLFNLDKEFDKYIINDVDRNITRIYETFKHISYTDYVETLNTVKKEFGSFLLRNDHNAKENYYNYRNWFNENHWCTNTTEEGIHLHILANSCINSFFRFGKNGMNQGYGNRFYVLDRNSFTKINNTLKRTEIYNVDYKEVLKENSFLFLDPPYFSQDSSYQGFNEDEFKIFLDIVKNTNNDFIYTDIFNEHNEKLYNVYRKLCREMKSTAPSFRRSESKLEYLWTNLPIVKPSFDEW